MFSSVMTNKMNKKLTENTAISENFDDKAIK